MQAAARMAGEAVQAHHARAPGSRVSLKLERGLGPLLNAKEKSLFGLHGALSERASRPGSPA